MEVEVWKYDKERQNGIIHQKSLQFGNKELYYYQSESTQPPQERIERYSEHLA